MLSSLGDANAQNTKRRARHHVISLRAFVRRQANVSSLQTQNKSCSGHQSYSYLSVNVHERFICMWKKKPLQERAAAGEMLQRFIYMRQ